VALHGGQALLQLLGALAEVVQLLLRGVLGPALPLAPLLALVVSRGDVLLAVVLALREAGVAVIITVIGLVAVVGFFSGVSTGISSSVVSSFSLSVLITGSFQPDQPTGTPSSRAGRP
jgi:hypothetical protein